VTDADRRHRATGLASATAAYLTWGLFPLYFHALAEVPAPEVLAHRIGWSAVFMAALVLALGRWGEAARQLRVPGTLPTLAASALLISTNWLVYIWAVTSDHVLEASLGYFVNPLVSVLLGVLVLREPLNGRQKVSVALAAAGVLSLVVRAGRLPWVAVVLAVTFGLYGLLRKRTRVDPVTGLLAEVGLLFPLAAGYLLWLRAAGQSHFPAGPAVTTLLAASGVVTAIPLLLFAVGVSRLRLSTVGLLQYLNPTVQFAIAILVFHEPFGGTHAVAFGCIWASLALYTADALGRGEGPRPVRPTGDASRS
jgi:chloramphenicol-sensitive protein RarD